MKGPVLLDTGPLVALLNRRERTHAQVKAALEQLPSPLFTAEPVLAEAMFLLRAVPGGPERVLHLVRDGLIRLPFAIETEVAAVLALMTRYADVPMSLADACLVRMVELMPDASVLTLDSDFRIYRARKSRVIQLVDL
ncbi:MAG: PIN domain-containing protein [Myxococcales bacterium]|nr:PIN domain-containing protein [Myxococcales bacterium]